jgi:hypothetical protein
MGAHTKKEEKRSLDSATVTVFIQSPQQQQSNLNLNDWVADAMARVDFNTIEKHDSNDL